MLTLHSAVDPQSESFRTNAQHHRSLAEQLRQRLREGREPVSAKAVAVQRERQKLLVRERIERLLDPETPFLELSPLAAYGCYEDPIAAAGLVTGIGCIQGKRCVVVANDATVKGGTYFPETIKKHLRAQQVALENRLPCVYLVDSGGVFLPMQSEVFADKEHFGRIFYNQAVMSAAGIPQLAVVLGMCTAGGAYVPAMSDENIIVEGTGTIYLAGPPLVKAATGEDVTAEELGGAAMHSRVSGVTDHLCKNEEEALSLCREIVGYLPDDTGRPVRHAVTEPLYPSDEIYGVLPRDPRQPYDVREVIARLVDGSALLEFKPTYGTTLVCGFARWMGYPVGIVANNGVIFSESALKGAHFVELCNQRRVPLVFLQNITGFMVGKRYEAGGITKDGAKMVQAVATATVPRITLIIGASHGAGNYAMCGRGYLPRFLFSWPQSRTSVMGAEQAASVLVQIKREQRERAGEPFTQAEAEAEAEAIAAPIREKYEREGDPYFGTARLWDDGIIDPKDTRAVIGLALDVVLRNPGSTRPAPVFRM